MIGGRAPLVCAGLTICLTAGRAAAQDVPPDVEVPGFVVGDAADREGPERREQDVSIDDLLRTSVYVVSKKPQLVRESPGVVTVITREEIIDSGARDLIDVLHLVPGFGFGVDVQGVVSVGFRGQWATEGKALFLIDGQEMNELLYTGVQLGNHFPLEHIERIEVIRGPGSAVYGGFAELTVINIVTRGARQLDGVAAAVYYGQAIGGHGGLGRARASVEAGDKRGDLSVSLSAELAEGIRSDRRYTDVVGDGYFLDDNADLDPVYVSAAVEYRALRLRFIYDYLHTTTRDGFGENSVVSTPQDFTGLYADAQYDARVGDDLVITPRLNLKRQTPWQDSDPASDFHYDKTVSRYLAGLTASYDASAKLNLLAGVEGFYDLAALNDLNLTGLQSMFVVDGEDRAEVSYTNLAGYAQASLSHKIANVTLGARAENHSQFGASFVPRLGVTRVFGRLHAKLLAARAFRAPAIENINTFPEIVPERTTVFEVETGYQVSDHVVASGNVFDATIDNPIVYSVDDMGAEGYFNFERTGSRGGEVDVKVRYPRWYLYGSASYYTEAGKNLVDLYEVPGRTGPLLAFPQLKVTAHGSVRLAGKLQLAPSAIVMSKRYALTGDGVGGVMLTEEKPLALVNAYVSYPDLGAKGLEVGAGVYNILDADYAFIQPYDGGHAPLPGPSREVVARLAYHLGF